MKMRRIEAVVIVWLLAMLGVVVYPSLRWYPATSRAGLARIRCLHNLKEFGMAATVWANDHEKKYPFQISANSGGTLEYTNTADLYRHFAVMSNELSNPKVLICPWDTERQPAADFATLRNQNLSYFLNLKAVFDRGHWAMLAGDRKVEFYPYPHPPRWSSDLHEGAGNLCFTFGPPEMAKTNIFRNSRGVAVQLVFPE